jgi:hypothetical protein
MALTCSLLVKVCFTLFRYVPKLVLDKPYRACLTLAKGLPWSQIWALQWKMALKSEIIPGDLGFGLNNSS